MKTLDQLDAKLEKRTPISSVPFTIYTPGSYYLTGNLAVATGNAITVTVDQVTLDLNGFTISSTASPASGTAVLLSGTRQKRHHPQRAHPRHHHLFRRHVHHRRVSRWSDQSFSLEHQSARVGPERQRDGQRRHRSRHGRAGHRRRAVHGLGLWRDWDSVGAGPRLERGHHRQYRDCWQNRQQLHRRNGEYGGGVGRAINASSSADNCSGVAVSGVGVSATNATNCHGTSTSGTGSRPRMPPTALASARVGTASWPPMPPTARHQHERPRRSRRQSRHRQLLPRPARRRRRNYRRHRHRLHRGFGHSELGEQIARHAVARLSYHYSTASSLTSAPNAARRRQLPSWFRVSANGGEYCKVCRPIKAKA